MGKEKKTVLEEKLPWEMIEEILSRVPPKSLACFRTVAKKWNALFEDKMFINNHKSTFRFILATKSKIFSVSIGSEIVVRELTLDIPGLESQIPKKLVDCNELLLCHMDKGVAIWNPWLKQTMVVKAEPNLIFRGIGYDRNRRVKENGYDIIASYWTESVPNHTSWTVHDFATDAWKDLKSNSSDDSNHGRKSATLKTTNGASLNGKMYWITFYGETDPVYYLHEFDFSANSFFRLCKLPCLKNHPRDALAIGVFEGDRLSFLKQCHVTKKIEIRVTENKINNDDDVVWKIFMEVSIPNLPDLVHVGSDSQPSYFIEDKTLVVCCCDETGRAWIYVMAENKLIRKIKIESVVDPWPLHCTYFPSFVPVPQGPREEAELQSLV